MDPILHSTHLFADSDSDSEDHIEAKSYRTNTTIAKQMNVIRAMNFAQLTDLIHRIYSYIEAGNMKMPIEIASINYAIVCHKRKVKANPKLDINDYSTYYHCILKRTCGA